MAVVSSKADLKVLIFKYLYKNIIGLLMPPFFTPHTCKSLSRMTRLLISPSLDDLFMADLRRLG